MFFLSVLVHFRQLLGVSGEFCVVLDALEQFLGGFCMILGGFRCDFSSFKGFVRFWMIPDSFRRF